MRQHCENARAIAEFLDGHAAVERVLYPGLPSHPGHEIAARQMKIDVLGISCITNMAAGVLPRPLDHAEVMETAARVRGQFIALLEGIIGQL